jgi:hypothetical protein
VTPYAKAVEVVAVEKKSRAERFHEDRQYRLASGEVLSIYGTALYPYDEETEARFKALQQEHDAARAEYDAFNKDWRERWRAEVEKLERLTPDEVKALRDQAKAEGK